MQMKKTILITGATGAIGSATALELAKTGARVILFSRNKTKLEKLKNEISKKTGNNEVDFLVADFSLISSVKKAVTEFKQRYNRLDVLINTAATYKSKREVTADNLETMFAVNHLAPFIIANKLIDLLSESKPARVITVTAPSKTKFKFDDLQARKNFSPLSAFGASKAMNLMFSYTLANKLAETGITSIAFFPGLVKSDLTQQMPKLLRFITRLLSRKATKAAKMLTSLAVDPSYQNSNGKFYKFNGKEIKSSKYSEDKNIQEKLWDISANLTGLSVPKEKIVITTLELISF